MIENQLLIGHSIVRRSWKSLACEPNASKTSGPGKYLGRLIISGASRTLDIIGCFAGENELLKLHWLLDANRYPQHSVGAAIPAITWTQEWM
jgi:hypothetical protein